MQVDTTRKKYNEFHKDNRLVTKVINDNNFVYGQIIKFINSNLPGLDGLNAIDIGCGAGTIDFYLAKRGCNITGLDVSPKAIYLNRMNSKLLKIHNKARFIQVEIPKIDKEFIGYLYDMTLCLETLEHIRDDEAVIKLLYDLTKTKGYLFLSVPLSTAPLRRLGLTKEFDKRVGHLRRYNSKQIIELLQKYGFIVKQYQIQEGIIRNILFVFPILNSLVKYIRGPMITLFTLIDNFAIFFFGGSNIIIFAQKK